MCRGLTPPPKFRPRLQSSQESPSCFRPGRPRSCTASHPPWASEVRHGAIAHGSQMEPPLTSLLNFPTTGRGGGKGKGFGGGRGKGKGGKGGYDEGPPESVMEIGTFVHPCEGEMVIKSTNEKVASSRSSAASQAICFLFFRPQSP